MALTRRALGGLTVGGSAAAVLAACGGNEGGSGGKTELVWAISSAWVSWNENTLDGNNSYGHQAMFPMTDGVDGNASGDWDENGEYHINDAVFESQEIISESPMQVQYTLKEGAQWSDGNPIRVEDFIFQWYSMSGNEEHANQEKAAPSATGVGGNIETIEETEPGVIVVTFVEGHLDPEWQFNFTFYLPSQVAEANGFEDWQNDPAVMGDAIEWFGTELRDVVVGPYVPVESSMGEFITYEINENYQGSVQPTIERITMRVVEGTESIVTELRQGEIDGSWPSEYNADEFAKLEEDPAIASEVFPGGVWLHIDTNFNTPALQDQALRQAIFTAIDVQDGIERNYPDTEVDRRLNLFFSQESEFFEDHFSTRGLGEGDIDAATQILTDAGYTGVGEALVDPDGNEVSLNIRYGEGDTVRTTYAELAQAQLQQLGINLELNAIPDGDLGTVLQGGDFDLVIFGWSGSPAFVGNTGQIYQTDVNYGSYSVPELDELVGQILSTTDLAEGAGFANELDDAGAELALVLPLLDEPQGIAWNTNTVEGVKVNSNSQAGPIFNIREWTLL